MAAAATSAVQSKEGIKDVEHYATDEQTLFVGRRTRFAGAVHAPMDGWMDGWLDGWIGER